MKRVIRPKGWGPWPTKEQVAAHKGDWRWRVKGDSNSLELYGNYFAEYYDDPDDDEYLAVDDDGSPVDIIVEVKEMKLVIREKGWGPWPTKEQHDAHKGQWLGRDHSAKRLFGASAINTGGEDRYEFLAVDDDATPVEVVQEVPPDFTYGDVQYYRTLGCAWKVYKDGRFQYTYASTARLLHDRSLAFLEEFFNKFPL